MTNMTTNTDVAMPELPVVAYFRTNASPGSSVASAALLARYPEHKHDYEEPLVKLSDASAAIQQAAGAVPEGRVVAWRWRFQDSCWIYNDASSDPSGAIGRPGWKVEFLGVLPSASPSPPKQQPVHLVGGEVSGVPLSDERRLDIASNWFSEEWAINRALGVMDDCEAAHGIGKAPRHESPTGQINQPATAGQGMEGGV